MFRPENLGRPSSADIYVTHLHQEEWTAAENVGAPVNTVAAEFHPTFSADGKDLFFARNDPAVGCIRTCSGSRSASWGTGSAGDSPCPSRGRGPADRAATRGRVGKGAAAPAERPDSNGNRGIPRVCKRVPDWINSGVPSDTLLP